MKLSLEFASLARHRLRGACVFPTVEGELAGLTELQSTAFHGALVKFGSRVNRVVFSQALEGGKRLPTDGALMLDPHVTRFDVPSKVVPIEEGLTATTKLTYWARTWFHFTIT